MPNFQPSPAGREPRRAASADVEATEVDLSLALAQHGRWLRTVLVARGVEPGVLEELMQQVALEAVRGLDRLEDASRIAPWLYRIAIRQALLYRRRMGRHRRLMQNYAQRVLPRESEPDPLVWLVREEQGQLVRDALATLSPGDAEIMLLKYTQQWSYQELAQRLGVSESAVESRLHRARERLRRAMTRLVPELVTEGVVPAN
jgi:RNA polymerase sigma-70 factor (ECF subfamily)